tara:strand:- start:176 stop:289 length:114 start_codon:yes stop_codon:yes gene_type:complete
VSGVTDTALLELREGLFAIIATGQAALVELYSLQRSR